MNKTYKPHGNCWRFGHLSALGSNLLAQSYHARCWIIPCKQQFLIVFVGPKKNYQEMPCTLSSFCTRYKNRRFMKVACLKNLKPDRVELARCHLFRCIFLSVKDQGPPWLSSVIKVISKCSCENTRRLNPNDSLALLPLGLVASRFSHPRWIWIYFWKGMQHGGRCCCKKRRWEEWRSQKYGVGHGWVCFFFISP